LPSSRCNSRIWPAAIGTPKRAPPLLRSRRRQCALRGQPAPKKQLIRRYAVSARHQADRYAGFLGLGHDRQLLRRRPPPAALWSVQDLTLQIAARHRHNITPTSYRSGRTCPVN
jgi:hypothetical protein